MLCPDELWWVVTLCNLENGETKPERGSSSRESIMQLPAEPLPPLGSPEDLALEPVQHECRAIGGGLAHLSRIRIDLAFDHAWISQGTARPTPKHLEHFKELLRYAWSTINLCHRHVVKHGLVLHDGDEPIRPYDTTLPSPRTATFARHSATPLVEYGLYGILDSAQAIPGINVVNSKSMGGLAIMLGAAAIDWKAWRHHTVVVDSTSGEMLSTSRAATKMYYYRRVSGFCGLVQDRPSPLLCDNDGVWSIAKDGAGTTSLIYIIRHVRYVQQGQEEGEFYVGQIDGRINPTDGLTKWLPRDTRRRDNMFLMGFPVEAYQFWITTKLFKTFVPRKIVPPPAPPVEVSSAVLANATANLRVTTPTATTVPVDEQLLADAQARQGTSAARNCDEVILSHAKSRGVANT